MQRPNLLRMKERRRFDLRIKIETTVKQTEEWDQALNKRSRHSTVALGRELPAKKVRSPDIQRTLPQPLRYTNGGMNHMTLIMSEKCHAKIAWLRQIR